MHLPYHIEVPVSAIQNGALEPITTTIFKYDDLGDTGPPLFVAYDGMIRPVQCELTGH